MPATVPRIVASSATMMMSREPTITREKTSLPRLSVPNQCSAGRRLEGVEALVWSGS